jgi:hypothetical protein
LADFLLDFPAYFFANTFGFQVGIVRQLADLFLNLALHFVNLACDLIFSTWLQFVASSKSISAQLFRRCHFELIGHVRLSGHAYSFGFQVDLLRFRPHWPSERNFAVLNEDFDVAPVGRETLIVMDRFSDFLRNRAVQEIHLPLIRGRAYPIFVY